MRVVAISLAIVIITVSLGGCTQSTTGKIDASYCVNEYNTVDADELPNNSLFEKCAKIDLVLILNDEEVINGSSFVGLDASKTDIIITSGAVSAGKYDFIPNVIKTFKLSNYFKSVAIRPGKPVLFAKIKNKQKVIFGLPGNPMSSAACFRFFVYPYIANVMGISEEKPISAILKNDFIKKKNFTRFAKSKLNTTKNGKIEVEILKGQESFRIKSFVKSNIWAVLPAGKSKFKKGQIVDCFFPNHINQSLI